MFGSLGSGAAGGAPAARTATVPSATGGVYTLSRLLGATSTLALIAGTDGNLTLNAATGVISATAAIGAGASQTAVVRESRGQLAAEYPVTLTGAAVVTPPAPALSLSSAVTQAEGDSGTSVFTWTLTLNRDGSAAAFPFAWAITGNGANPANAADFGGTLPSGAGTFAAGQTSKTITVLVSGDTAVEPAETFLLTVTAAGLNTVTSTGTISNDDTAPLPPADINTSVPLQFMTFDAPVGEEQFFVTGLSQAPVLTASDGPLANRLVVGAQRGDEWPILRGAGAVTGPFSAIVGDGQGNTKTVVMLARGHGRAIQTKTHNVLDVVKPQHAIDIQVAELNNANNHPSLGASTHLAIKSGFWRDPTVWSTGTVPNGYQPVDKQVLNPLTKVFETKSCGTAVVNIGSYTVTIDEDADFKHVHVGAAGKLYVVNKPGQTTTVTLDTHMGHGWADVRTVGTESAAVDFVFVQHEAPGATAKLGFNNHGRLRAWGGVRADELFADAALSVGQEWIHLPGLALNSTNWNLGDEVVIPFHGDGEQVADPAVGWTSQVPVDFSTVFVTDKVFNPTGTDLWPFFVERGFAVDRSQRRRILELDIAGERVRVAPLDRAVIVWSKDRVKPNADDSPGQVMRTRTLMPRVINEYRTIRLRSADPRTLQTRGHLMAMGGDSQLYGVHCMWMGRTSFDSTFASPSGDQAWSGDIVAGATNGGTGEVTYHKGTSPTLRTDPNNVPGRYPFHIGHQDGATFSDYPNLLLNCSESSPVWSILTTGMVSHGDRSMIFGGSVTGAKSRGWMAENGNEIGLGHNVKIVGVCGNGYDFEANTNHPNRRMDGQWWKMQNSYGVAWDSQSRHFGAFAIQAFDCVYRDSYNMQAFTTMSPVYRDFFLSNPYLMALTVSDPLAAGNNYAVLLPSGDPTKDTLLNAFWTGEANIYLNWDNIGVGCPYGRNVHGFDSRERTTDLPVEFLRCDCFGAIAPVRYADYVQRYTERDAIFARLNPVGGSAGALQFGGAATYGLNVVDVTTYNYGSLVADIGVGPNDQGHFLRLCNATSIGSIFSQQPRHKPTGGIYDGAFYDNPQNSPDRLVYGGFYDPVTKQLYTGTTWPAGGLLARLWRNLKDGDDWTQDGPLDAFNRTAPAYAAGKGPGVFFDPASDYEYDYATQKDLTGIEIHSGVGKIQGVYVDGFGVRAMGRNINAQVNPYSQGTGQGGPGRDFGTQTLDFFIRANGLWNDNGQWRIIVWSPMYDGATGIPYQTRNDRRVKNLTPEIIAACERNPLDTKQVMPPKVEVPKLTAMRARTTAPVLLAVPATLTLSPGEHLRVPLKSGIPTAKYTLSGANAADFEIAYVAGLGYGARYAGNAAAAVSDKTFSIVATDPENGLSSPVQSVHVVVTATHLLDTFTDYTGDVGGHKTWAATYAGGPGTACLVSNGDGTATLPSAGQGGLASLHDCVSRDCFFEFTCAPSNQATFVPVWLGRGAAESYLYVAVMSGQIVSNGGAVYSNPSAAIGAGKVIRIEMSKTNGYGRVYFDGVLMYDLPMTFAADSTSYCGFYNGFSDFTGGKIGPVRSGPL